MHSQNHLHPTPHPFWLCSTEDQAVKQSGKSDEASDCSPTSPWSCRDRLTRCAPSGLQPLLSQPFSAPPRAFKGNFLKSKVNCNIWLTFHRVPFGELKGPFICLFAALADTLSSMADGCSRGQISQENHLLLGKSAQNLNFP